jgi:hypothetical protein
MVYLVPKSLIMSRAPAVSAQDTVHIVLSILSGELSSA